jgi:hypothetical protein
MKRTTIILTLLSTVLITGSCDFFRIIAGRPDSAEIEQKRLAIEAERSAHQAAMDSLKKVERQLADSLAIVDSLKRKNETVMNPAKLGGLYTTALDAKYYVIIGSFMEKANARRLADEVSAKGYPAILIGFKNGYNAVGICPSGTLVDVYDALGKVKNEKFCPQGAWILEND